jgi:2-(1,2-epoxy-1,2-dihydrophenyl)acetyl-CoA isomerase
MTFETIEFRVDGEVAWLTLNRPERLNAFCRPMLAEIAEALDQAAAEPALRALIVTGAERAFSAGQDLTEPAIATEDPAAAVAESLDLFYHPVLERLHALKLPVVAAVNGIAAGAGANFALNCDIVIAAASASFIQAFTRIGLVPDCGGTWLLPRLVGPARARALMLLAEPLGAADAEAWGLIYKAVPDEALHAEAEALARRLAAGPTAAYGMIKQALDAAASHDLGRQLDLERELQSRAAASDDFREGVAAFLEKREPRFSGR